ncbi:MAG: hypothetical protein JXN61_07410 [Sedimentisphaerales bacterium]|nr:hypothetical protein [Sedimentisphaerales bacterium]
MLRIPGDTRDTAGQDRRGRRQRVYDEAGKEALIVMWEAPDRICGKRLKEIIPELMDDMERLGLLRIDTEVNC